MSYKQQTNSTNPDLEVVDAAIAFMQAAKKRFNIDEPLAGTGVRPDGLWDYAVGLAHAAMDALGGGGPVRDTVPPIGASENVRLESSLEDLIAHREAYMKNR